MLWLMLQAAVPADAEACVRLRDDAATWLLARGIVQWAVGEISVADVRAAITRGEVQVIRRRGVVVATVTVTSSDDVVWATSGDVVARYVHRLVVARGYPGLGAAVLAEVEARSAGEGAAVVRLDCVEANAWLRRWYVAQGYLEVGRVEPTTPGWHPSTLLEKPLLTPPQVANGSGVGGGAVRGAAGGIQSLAGAVQPGLAAGGQRLAALPQGERVLQAGAARLEPAHDVDQLVASLLVAQPLHVLVRSHCANLPKALWITQVHSWVQRAANA